MRLSHGGLSWPLENGEPTVQGCANTSAPQNSNSLSHLDLKILRALTRLVWLNNVYGLPRINETM